MTLKERAAADGMGQERRRQKREGRPMGRVKRDGGSGAVATEPKEGGAADGAGPTNAGPRPGGEADGARARGSTPKERGAADGPT